MGVFQSKSWFSNGCVEKSGGEDLDAVLRYLDDPAGEQAKIEKKGKWVVRTEKKGE